MRNHPNPEKLTASTPKGSYFRNREGNTPNQSPIYSSNSMNAAPDMSFDSTYSTIHPIRQNSSQQSSLFARRVWNS